MKEIGGYFGLEEFTKSEYYDDLKALNTGRNALVYLLRSRNIKKLYIPYFICDSVINACKRENIEYEQYHISEDFLPIFNKSLKDDEFLYVVNYYGQISNNIVIEYKETYKNVIFDNVQAFYQKPVIGIDTLYSCRKFFGVPDGAYLSTDSDIGTELEIDKSKDRMEHLLGRFEETASEYYACFAENDESFEQAELKYMSPITHNILRATDYDYVKIKREENYRILEKAFEQKNAIAPVMPEGPYCYPLYCSDGMNVKAALAKEKIYVPTLWPNVRDLDECLEKDYAENILPLPCDQRYDLEDMARIINTINLILK